VLWKWFHKTMVKLCIAYVPEFEQKKALIVASVLWKWFH